MSRLELSPEQRRSLERIARRRSTRATEARRARVILMSADGVSGREIAARLGISAVHVSRIRKRFLERGLEGLHEARKAGRKDHAVTAATVERIVHTTLLPPPAGRVRWTTRLLADKFDLSSPTISKILRDHRLKPHAVRTYKASRNPAFVEGVTDVVGVYINPPESAIVVRVDDEAPRPRRESQPIPVPLHPSRSAPHTHDYKRYGLLDLYTALDVATGEPVHACAEKHTANDFLGFMRLIVGQHRRRELHVVVDNSSPRCTPAIARWLQRHPRVTVHYAPTTASWLDQVHGFFGILANQSRRSTTLLPRKHLRAHIAAYIADWNEDPTPFIWTKPCHCNHWRATNE